MRGYREADDGFRENALHGVLSGLTGRVGSRPAPRRRPTAGGVRSTLSCRIGVAKWAGQGVSGTSTSDFATSHRVKGRPPTSYGGDTAIVAELDLAQHCG